MEKGKVKAIEVAIPRERTNTFDFMGFAFINVEVKFQEKVLCVSKLKF
jgi:hypothetical protein